MRLVLLGKGLRGYSCLSAILQEGYSIPLSVAADDHPGMLALGSLSIPHSELLPYVQDVQPDIIITAGYPFILSPPFFITTIINLHASLLPYYRGPHPLNWMLIRGETAGGVSIVMMDHGIDTGPILAQEPFTIHPNTTYMDLVHLTSELFPPLLLSVLSRLSSGERWGKRQDLTKGFWCCRRFPSDGIIDWSAMTDIEVHNLVRALSYPMPGARSAHLAIERTRLIRRTYLGIPGRVAAHWPSGFVVICRNRGLLVTELRTTNSWPDTNSTLEG